jgi:prephenate dehydrogenase
MIGDPHFPSPGDPAFPAPLGTVTIFGMGLIGGSIGLALRARRLAARVVGIGRSLERLQTAIERGAADAVTTDLAEGLADADVVILCSTVSHILATIPDALRLLPPGAVLTDVGSTKEQIVLAAGGAPYFVGGHPMAGSERAGIEAATATLFEKATWAVTPHPTNDPDAVRTVQALAEVLGANVLVVPPATHDAMVAITSHLPHVLSSALMRQARATAAEHRDTPRLAAGGFADMTRIAASSPEIWRDICLSNRGAVLAALRAYRAELDVIEQAVADSDAAAIESFFAAGADAKRSWPGRG